MTGLYLTDFWESEGPKAKNTGTKDAGERPVRLEPPEGGTVFRVVEFPPDKNWRGKGDSSKALNSIQAGHAPVAGATDRDDAHHLDGRFSDRRRGEDLRGHGQGRDLAQDRGRDDPARHQPFLGEPLGRAVFVGGDIGERGAGEVALVCTAAPHPPVAMPTRSLSRREKVNCRSAPVVRFCICIEEAVLSIMNTCRSMVIQILFSMIDVFMTIFFF